MNDVMYNVGMSLVKKKVIAFSTFEEALKRHKNGGNGSTTLADILIKDFEVNEDQVYHEVARIYGYQEFKLDTDRLDELQIKFIKTLLERLPEDTRKKMISERFLVLRLDETISYKFQFIAVNPANPDIPKIARMLGARRHEILRVNAADFERLMDVVYPQKNEYLREMDNVGFDLEEAAVGEEDEEEAIEAEINKSALVNLIEGMLVEGVRRGVSDIHIIPRDARTAEILFREDGKLYTWHTQRGLRPEALVAVVKDRSKNVDRFERERAQDGFIQRHIDGCTIRFRVSILPIVASDVRYKLESVVLRILDDRNVITNFEDLGFKDKAQEMFLKAIAQPQGMIILTGPTGSGKSTTLLAALTHVNRPDNNVLTVEDPVEYMIEGVRQIKLGPKNNFDQALRSILRHDPDVVMVGEIRDQKSAEIAIKLANTGHLTFSTLHTNDAPSAISRLYKMEIETFLLAYAINAVVAQRLIRRLCPKCKEPDHMIDYAVPLSLGFTSEEVMNASFFRARGCDECNNGYRGRIAIHEVLYFSKDIRNMIFSMGTAIDEEKLRAKAIHEGMLTLREAGKQRVLEGVTSLEELASATSSD